MLDGIIWMKGGENMIVPSNQYRHETTAKLALLYMEKMNIGDMSATDFTKKYFEVAREIDAIISNATTLP